MSRHDRWQTLINLLQSRPGIKARELAEETGVCERTIFRDLMDLAREYSVVNNRGYSLSPAPPSKPITLTKAEYILLQLALTSPALQRADLRVRTCSLKAKIDAATDLSVRSCSARTDTHAPSSGRGCSDIKRVSTFSGILQLAIATRRAVDVLYEDDIGEDCARIYPYRLVYCHPDWVVVGYVRGKKEYEAFRLNTLKEISLTSHTFQKDDSFSLEKFFQSRWYLRGGQETTVKLRFKGKGAKRILSQRHHPKEEVIEDNDGSVLYTLTVRGVEEMIPWILSFGPDAEILAPEFLRELVKEQAGRLASIYRKKLDSRRKDGN